jgi:hypothetical protein
MSEKKKYEIAKKIVDKQLDTMKKFSAAPKGLSDKKYKNMIGKIAESVRT